MEDTVQNGVDGKVHLEILNCEFQISKFDCRHMHVSFHEKNFKVLELMISRQQATKPCRVVHKQTSPMQNITFDAGYRDQGCPGFSFLQIGFSYITPPSNQKPGNRQFEHPNEIYVNVLKIRGTRSLQNIFVNQIYRVSQKKYVKRIL